MERLDRIFTWIHPVHEVRSSSLTMVNFDDTEFQNLYRQYYPYIFKTILAISRNMDLAEDLTQETFLKIYKYRETFNPEKGTFKSWSLVIARNVWAKHVKKGFEDMPGDSHLESIPVPDESHAEKVNKKLIQEQIVKVIDRLKEPDRSIIIHRYLGGLTLKEIGVKLNTSESTISRRLVKAVELLREALEKKDIV